MVPYKLSFTTGGLLATEARITAQIRQQSDNWERTRAELREQNPFGIRVAASVTRISREVVDRLRVLDADELKLVADGSPSERNAIMWLAATRRYLLIEQFATEVLRERADYPDRACNEEVHRQRPRRQQSEVDRSIPKATAHRTH